MKRIIIGLLVTVCVTGCAELERKHQAGVAVELNGHFLYQATLDSMTLGLNSEDSATVTQQYIRQWAQDMLVYDGAHNQRNDAIERMVDDYRKTLYVQAYEQRLIDKRMPKQVEDSAVAALYAQLGDRLQLKESIVKGILVIAPNEAPYLQDLRRWLLMANGEVIASAKGEKAAKTKGDKAAKAKGTKGERTAGAKGLKAKGEKAKTEEVNEGEQDPRSEALDNIEKYAYQYSSGYELFTDEWKTASELQLLMPFERNELDGMLRRNSQIELSDSINTYLLQVTEKYLSGERTPMDYARPQLEEYILSTRQAQFLQEERERLYQEAIDEKKLKFYE